MAKDQIEKFDNTEYQSLRQEILEQFNREFNTISIGLSSAVVIVGYGITQKSPYLFFVPLLVLALTLIQFTQSHYTILRIATFIRVCIEKREGEIKSWKTCMHKYRDKEKEINQMNA